MNDLPRGVVAGKEHRALVWFRSDLRVRDNTALTEACHHATHGVVAVFVVCPEQWREHDWAEIKVDFVIRNLTELSTTLAGLNISLKILSVPRFAGVPRALLRLARDTRCDALFFNREYEFNEARRDREVGRRFARAGLGVHPCTDQVIVEPGQVKTREGRWFSVFTPFKRAWVARLLETGDPPVLPAPRSQAPLNLEPDPVPARVAGFDPARGRPDLWKAGEDHARGRLTAFVRQRLERYNEQRDLPALNGTSTLSPYLTAGVLSPRQCLASALRVAPRGLTARGGGPDTWIGELVWREFYKHLLVGFPRLSKNRPFRPETDRLRWSSDGEAFAAWCEGRTGFPIVDAAMRQLEQTGWMHNRLRMIAAMFLTKDLFIDWRQGERWFMRRLVDGDLAANNGGWQWSASTGTDAAPYFRIFNPVSQSERFDPEGRFLRRFLPELAALGNDEIHDPSRLPAERRRKLDYPEPICDHAAARRRTIAAFKSLKTR